MVGLRSTIQFLTFRFLLIPIDRNLQESNKGRDMKEEYEEDLQKDLLSSLRHQLTKTALKDRKLKAKANRVTIFHPNPRKRVSLSSLRSHYRNRPLSQEIAPIEEEHKEKLNSELQEALKVQLARLEGDLAAKIQLEDTVKKNLETELSESLRSQFSSVFRSLSATTLSPQHVEIQKLSDSEVKQALDQQLRAFLKF